jgi:acyl transferase domain-containing protein/acyl carrier protein
VERKEALQRAIEELARQRAEIERLRREAREPIAVVGMACRFPGASSPEAFWDLLAGGVDAVTEVPRTRWNADAFYDPDPAAPGKMATSRGAFIDGADLFDPQFFGIAPREAQSMDPQQRILLEVAWEALEHAGIAPTDLYGSATAVFVGITCFDHAMRLGREPSRFDAYAGTGSALNMAPGRVSYVLGLTGPSMAIDTACSSSLVGLHLACQSLRQRESNLALVGGVHLILSPEVMVSFSQARMLAADGRSKTFDASADGYSRGEGCGVVVLKRLADAVADRDRILGVIRGTAVNQDGPSGGLTVPNGAAQQQVIRRALEAAAIEPAAVGYVEAHGTGTSLGDPIEVEALAKVYGQGRSADAPLLVGAVKTNIGHLEPAAGMAGLIKLLLAFEHETIPRHLHFRTPNPHIPWRDLPVAVAAEPRTWPRSDRPRLAGLSAFGFSGTNAHVIVEEPPVTTATHASARKPHLLPVSAKSEQALKDLAARYAARLAQASDDDLASICYTAGAGRAHFPHRLVAVVSSRAEAQRALEAYAQGGEAPAVRSGKAGSTEYRRDGAAVAARLEAAYRQIAEDTTGRPSALTDVGALYLEGITIDWARLYAPEPPPRVALPTYAFERQRYWLDLGDRPSPSSSPAPSMYQLAWTEVASAAPPLHEAASRRWAVVSGDRDLGQRLCGVLGERGAAVSTTTPREAVTSATDVVFIAGVTRPSDTERACQDLLALSQSLAAAPGARIWVVTRGALSESGVMTSAGAAQAPVAAFARVLGLEHPELFGRSIDLDSQARADDAERLLDEMLLDDPEDQVALRRGRRYAQRVDSITDIVTTPLSLRADATYLITGGLGRIGLLMARELARAGARHLCLVSRRGPAASAQRDAIAALEALGVQVRVASVDVSDSGAMAALVDDLTAGRPLAGVVHAAGVAGYVALDELTSEAFADVLRPKVQGAWVLHTLTRERPLDFFVCCSSIASAWGSRGQAHYAAANAYLDALAHLRRAEGLPAATINWGPWREGGMTTAEAETLLRRVGVRPLATESALAAFGMLSRAGRPQVVVADIDWALFKGSYEARGHRRLLERLAVTTTAEPHDAAESELQRRLATTAPADRERVLVEIVQREVAQVLGLPASQVDPEQGLFEIGMDSLTALELRTRLETVVGRALPATLVFDCPNVRAIARLLLTAANRAAAPAPARVAVAAPPAAAAEALDLEALSDEDAEALLLKKLDSIH